MQRYRLILRGLPTIVLACSLVATPANAQFTQQAKLVGTGFVGSPVLQGYSVALSGDGNTAIVGGENDHGGIGAAWVWVRSRGMWTQEAKLVGTGRVGLAAQGWSVSLSRDGDTAIVGGPVDHNNAGAAWVFTRSRETWTQQAKLIGTGAIGGAAQGSAVSLSGDGNTAIVGGQADHQTGGGVSGWVGAAWVFTRSHGAWTQRAKLVGTGALGLAEQGHSVALSNDGDTAAIGGPSDDHATGAVWVFTRSRGVWSQQSKLVGSSAIGKPVLQGFSVSLSSDGRTAMVGGPGDNGNVGASWMFTRSGGGWTQEKLVGTGVVGSFGAVQGGSVSLSGNGNIAVVGGDNDNDLAGAAWVFTRSARVWTQQAKLVGTGAIGNALQGNSVAVSGDGKTILVGGPDDNRNLGAVWVYAHPVFAGTPRTTDCFGESVSALSQAYGDLNAAAAALNYSDESALHDAVSSFCAGN
jgi:FG-GAP repeat